MSEALKLGRPCFETPTTDLNDLGRVRMCRHRMMILAKSIPKTRYRRGSQGRRCRGEAWQLAEFFGRVPGRWGVSMDVDRSSHGLPGIGGHCVEFMRAGEVESASQSASSAPDGG